MKRTKFFLALVAVIMVAMMVALAAPAMADNNRHNDRNNNCCDHNDHNFFNRCCNDNEIDFDDVFEDAFLVPVVVFVIDDNCDGVDDDLDFLVDEDAVCDFDSFDLDLFD